MTKKQKHTLVVTVGYLILAVGCLCVLLPLYDKLYGRISKKWRFALCLLLLAVFIADATYCAVRPNTGRGISQGG